MIARVEYIRIWLDEHRRVHHDGRRESTCIVCKLVDDVHDLTSTSSVEPLRPRIVLNRTYWNPRFGNNGQQDESEAWTSLLNTLDQVDDERLQALALC